VHTYTVISSSSHHYSCSYAFFHAFFPIYSKPVWIAGPKASLETDLQCGIRIFHARRYLNVLLWLANAAVSVRPYALASFSSFPFLLDDWLFSFESKPDFDLVGRRLNRAVRVARGNYSL
jgi:hypothetical protein